MAMTSQNQGFALLIAVIFVSVILAIALALGSIGYKQEIIARGASDSQYAFYAADAALECALVEAEGGDPVGNPFAYANHNLGFTFPCAGEATSEGIPAGSGDQVYNSNVRTSVWRIDIASNNPLNPQSGQASFCADVTVNAPSPTNPNQNTYVFAQGYSIPCSGSTGLGSGATFSARGLYATFR